MSRQLSDRRAESAQGRREQSDRGTTAVEFAIVVPLLLLILLGIIDFGRLLFVQVSLNAASREGARASSLYAPTSTQQSSVVTRITDIVQQSSPGTARLSALSDIPLVVSTAGLCSPTATDEITAVAVTVPFQWITPVAFFGVSGPSELRSESRMLCVG
jgi:Flp pilus assembly protein TadG